MRGGTAGRDAPTGYPLLGHPSRSPEKFFCDGRPIHKWNGSTGFCTFFWFRGGTPPQNLKKRKNPFFSHFSLFFKKSMIFSINFYQNLSGRRLFFQKSFQLFSRENFSHSAWSRRENAFRISAFFHFSGVQKKCLFFRCALGVKKLGPRNFCRTCFVFSFASFWVDHFRFFVVYLTINDFANLFPDT